MREASLITRVTKHLEFDSRATNTSLDFALRVVDILKPLPRSFLRETEKVEDFDYRLKNFQPPATDVNKNFFSSIQEGDQLFEDDMKKPPEQRNNRIAVVNCITKGYDPEPPQVPESFSDLINVDFFFYTDNFDHPVKKPWKRYQLPYSQMNQDSDTRAHNSLSTLPYLEGRQTHIGNMQCKYIQYMGWSLPEFQNHRYLIYMGGGFVFNHVNPENFTKDFLNLLEGDHVVNVPSDAVHKYANIKGRRKLMAAPLHPKSKTPLEEATASSLQARYKRDRVTDQAMHYEVDHLMPGDLPVLWLGITFFDTYSSKIRELLREVFEESQIWSLEDQVSFSFVLWRKDLFKDANFLEAGEVCGAKLLHTPAGQECRALHKNMASYGS
eukprot:TRINITY_DN8480_c0_g1_i1.p1 TRINITY_DN8480_c0_g1~~TRINITY_DN8480_c0_g1_i1.p1  ORF type:complete len:383 (-),score=102.95 TRINITY_DN8480_c0_g1_i1:120-1268(-)